MRIPASLIAVALLIVVAGPAAATPRVPRVSTIVSPPEQALPMVEKRFVGLKRRRLSRAYKQSASVIAVSQQAERSSPSRIALLVGFYRPLSAASRVTCPALLVMAERDFETLSASSAWVIWYSVRRRR